MRETLSGDLIERLIADIIEVTETLLTTSMLTIPGQDLISALVPSNPAPILEAVALKAGASAKVSNQVTHSKKNVIFSFFESIRSAREQKTNLRPWPFPQLNEVRATLQRCY